MAELGQDGDGQGFEGVRLHEGPVADLAEIVGGEGVTGEELDGAEVVAGDELDGAEDVAGDELDGAELDGAEDVTGDELAGGEDLGEVAPLAEGEDLTDVGDFGATEDVTVPDALEQSEEVDETAKVADVAQVAAGDDHAPRPAAPQQTGDARVDEALARLAGLDDLPLAAQVTVFDDVHRLLQDALTASDAVSAPGAPAR